ncbi:hypothetical protein EYF80_062947 [Liparis tanakae]|uniref:Uncharacterized protein n=1 Tax=Liparis tanakae TaxID=230148 RepID=A0A4Z2EED3_9TELE|nr:hypothetical protein EYF80_062947 [Liparis tanakae]
MKLFPGELDSGAAVLGGCNSRKSSREPGVIKGTREEQLPGDRDRYRLTERWFPVPLETRVRTVAPPNSPPPSPPPHPKESGEKTEPGAAAALEESRGPIPTAPGLNLLQRSWGCGGGGRGAGSWSCTGEKNPK